MVVLQYIFLLFEQHFWDEVVARFVWFYFTATSRSVCFNTPSSSIWTSCTIAISPLELVPLTFRPFAGDRGRRSMASDIPSALSYNMSSPYTGDEHKRHRLDWGSGKVKVETGYYRVVLELQLDEWNYTFRELLVKMERIRCLILSFTAHSHHTEFAVSYIRHPPLVSHST